ncbi:MAG: DNA-directed RNA polymerase subunit delta, partial [Bacilli bacterium]
LFKEITELLELPEKVFKTKIGDYYTSLTTDKRFILLENGIWDLRERHTSDKVIIAMDEDEEDEIIDNIDEEEEEIDEEFDKVIDDEEAIDDEDDDLKDLVIVDEEELELEQ